MARYKRYFPVSHDINLDPEFNHLCQTAGVAGVRFFLQILAMLDKTNNHVCLNSWFNVHLLARLCATKPKMILTSYQLLLDMKWITVGLDDDNNQFIYARNYAEYHRSRGRIGVNDVTQDVKIGGEGKVSLNSSLKKEVKKEITLKKELQRKKEPSTNGKVMKPDGLSEQIWRDFQIHRKGKRAVITKTVLDGFEREANKAGISLEAALQMSIERDWRGFKAEWVEQSTRMTEEHSDFSQKDYGQRRKV